MTKWCILIQTLYKYYKNELNNEYVIIHYENNNHFNLLKIRNSKININNKNITTNNKSNKLLFECEDKKNN